MEVPFDEGKPCGKSHRVGTLLSTSLLRVHSRPTLDPGKSSVKSQNPPLRVSPLSPSLVRSVEPGF